MKTCFNCQNQFHYVAECPYENREDHGGKLVYKSAGKAPIKKPYFKKNFSNKKSPSRMVLVTREEYILGDEDSQDKKSAKLAVIAITSSTSPSLFECPNEYAPTTSATCLMAKATVVIYSSTPKTMNGMHDHIGLRIKEENVALDRFMSNVEE